MTRGLHHHFDFPIGIGTSIEMPDKTTAYKKCVAREFNSITPENCFKVWCTEPQADQFNFTRSDAFVAFAQKHNMRIHGHNLLWHEFLPPWLLHLKDKPRTFRVAIKNHITTLITHYADTIHAWDVVNEAIDKRGAARPFWTKTLGPNFMADCFHWAHAADPSALLFYNDFGQDRLPRKWAGTKRILSELQDKRVPIHGLGLQSHLRIASDKAIVKRVLTEAAATGLLIHISELDIRMNIKLLKNPRFTVTRRKQQHAMFQYVFDAYRDIVPPEQQYGITLWNLHDAESWIQLHVGLVDQPCLFDDQLKLKYSIT